MITKLDDTQMQIGIDSFAAAYDDASLAVSASDRVRNLVEQIELLSKKRVIVLEFQAEQWKRLDERTATYNHFRPALRKKIEGGEVLKHPYRVG